MKKKFSAIALVLALIASVIVPFQAAQPVSTVIWNGATDIAAANSNMTWYDNTTRTNASGNKITSNAHSADFADMYFKWADKQSDDCYLKVEASAFETVEYFVLTAKTTNKYYDVKIEPADGQEMTDDGCYVFYLPRIIEKNKKGADEFFVINMVFLDMVQYKDNPSITVVKVWLNEDGAIIEGSAPAEVSFTDGYELGSKLVPIGTQVSFAENEIEGYELVGITVNDEPTDAVDFKALGNGRYTIVFTNQAVTIDVPAKGTLSLMKLLKQGEETVVWNEDHPFFDEDNDYIYFDLYKSNESGAEGSFVETAQADRWSGLISFTKELTAGQWYLIKERLELPEDHVRYGKYTLIDPILVQAWAEGTTGTINFSPIADPDPDTGIITKTDFILSNSLDTELKMYECLDTYNNFRNSQSTMIDLDDSVQFVNGAIVPYWKSRMVNYSNFEQLLKKIWFTFEGNDVYPQFVWNTNDFNQPDLGLSGNTLIFEKTFTPLDTLTDDTVPLYITGDNAFIVFVNDQYVGKSFSLMNGGNLTLDKNLILSEETLQGLVSNREESYVSGIDESTWAHTYSFDIIDYINPGVENTITIVGVNEACDNQNYFAEPLRNPGGIIFGCQIVSQTEKFRFVNELPEVEPSGMLVLSKFVEVNGEELPWYGSDYEDDYDLITFELYDPDALAEDPDCAPVATTGMDIFGAVRFEKSEDITPGKEYIVREKFDESIADKYVAQEWKFTAIENEEDLDIDWTQYEIVNKFPKHHVLISNPEDPALTNPDGNVVNVNKASTFWKMALDLYNESFTRYDSTNLFDTIKAIELDVNGTGYNAEYVWNTDDFSNVYLAQSGDIVKFEKTFTDVGEIVGDENGEVNLYIAADNAYLLFVNDKFVGQSETIIAGYNSLMYEENEILNVVGNLSDDYIDCQNYDRLDTFSIMSFLESNTDNTVTIIVINESADESGQHTHRSGGWNVVGYNEYEDWGINPDKNPAAAIFACEFWSK